mmetsp:Transcript_27744/g.42701  ORF Transcript_27744/g.42701 Transcript_27744/m.42701 type:complete len:165 (-) Transcript_27744:181-675(-)
MFPSVEMDLVLASTRKRKTSEENTERLRCAVGLHTLLLYHTKCREGRMFFSSKPSELGGGLDAAVWKQLIEMYSSPSSRGRMEGKQQRDKRIVAMLILYIRVHGSDMRIGDLSPLMKDAKLESTSVMAVLREAGFSTNKRAGGSISAALHVPLEFPPPPNRRRR